MKFPWQKYITKGFQSEVDKPITDVMNLNMKANRDKIEYFFQHLTQERMDCDPDIVEYANKKLFGMWNAYCEHSKNKI